MFSRWRLYNQSILLCLRQYHYKPKDRHVLQQPVPEMISKDYILFKCEQPGKILLKNLSALTLFPVWSYLGYFSFTLKTKVVEPYEEEFRKQNKSVWVLDTISGASGKIGIAFFLFGLCLMSYWISRTLHTVRRIVLRKGGKYVTLVTYGLLGVGSKFSTIPISHCNVVHQSFQGKQRMFLRVRNQHFKYQMNLQEGTFTNKPLFDKTVGISRKI